MNYFNFVLTLCLICIIIYNTNMNKEEKMIWKFDFESETPIYIQIRNQVVLSVSKGELKPGDKLPTVRALSDESGINMMTVSKAYQLLKNEGYVVTERRSGTVVSSKIPKSHVSDETAKKLSLILAEMKVSGMSKAEILDICEKLIEEK